MQHDETLIATLATRVGPIADEVARDLEAAAPGGDVAERRALAETAVGWLLTELAAGDRIRPRSLESLRAAARRAATEGRSVASVIDPYLSAGWAIWETAAALPGTAAALPMLGGVLLRAGDAAAAAIAAAYADTEVALAAGTASARREFLDGLLAARPGEPSLPALIRRGTGYGLEPGLGLEIVIAAVDEPLGDDTPAIGQLTAALGPRATIVATDRGRALVVLRAGVVRDAVMRAALDGAFGPGRWTAIRALAEGGPAWVGHAANDAHAALGVAVRRGRRGAIEPPEATLLEQVMLVDAARLGDAVEAILGPLTTTPRTGGQLVDTLRVFLETAGNRRETARRLGLAPRTVAYRLRRIEVRLGARLIGPGLLRLAAAVLAQDLLEPPVPAGPAATQATASTSPVRPRRGPRRRSPDARC